MTPEQERWAEAVAVERMFGANARAHAAMRIADLDRAGDAAGRERWREIAERLGRLDPDNRGARS